MNLLPNTNWQVFSSLAFVTRQGHEGAGPQAPIVCTSSTLGNTPTFYTANTGQLTIGTIGYFVYGSPSISIAPARVTAINPNVSFTVQLPWNEVLSNSCSPTFVPIGIGDYSSSTNPWGPDGWMKTPSLIIWADDFSSNTCPGAVRVLGCRKASSSPEYLIYQVPASEIARYKGRTIQVGSFVWQKLQQASGTWELIITDDNGTSVSPYGVGAAYNDTVYGGYQDQYTSRTFGNNITFITICINFTGQAGDIYYVARPATIFGSSIFRDDLQQNRQELLRTNNHINPPSMVGVSYTFPATPIPSTGTLYGYDGLDLECLTYGQFHNSIKRVTVNMEITSPIAGAYLGMSKYPVYSQTTFGPSERTQIGNLETSTQAELSLSDDGKFTLYADTPSTHFSNITMDMYDPWLTA